MHLGGQSTSVEASRMRVTISLLSFELDSVEGVRDRRKAEAMLECRGRMTACVVEGCASSQPSTPGHVRATQPTMRWRRTLERAGLRPARDRAYS